MKELFRQSKKINLHVQIVGSSNPRLNAMVKDSQFTIAKTLRPFYRKVGISVVDTLADLEALVAKKPDLVVLGMKLVLLDPAMEYDESRKVWLSDYLLERGIAVTGSDTAALKLEFDKHEAKQTVIDAGLKSAAYFLSTAEDPTFAHALSYPLFVKPTNRGDSKGIDEKSVVYTNTNLRAKILSIHKELFSDVLVEEYLSGKEYSVAVIRVPGSKKLLAMPVELRAPMDRKGNRFLSEEVKQSDVEKVYPVVDTVARNAVNKLAIGVFKALGARDYGRIDVRMDSLGVPSFIEANLMPGLSLNGYLSRCFMLNEQRGYEDMICTIIALASERCIENESRITLGGLLPVIGFEENLLQEA